MKRSITLYFSCLTLLIFAGESKPVASVTADGNGTGIIQEAQSNSTTLPSFNVPEGDNALLVVQTYQSNSRAVTSITFNGSNLTKLGNSAALSGYSAEIWYLALGNVGVGGITSNVVVSYGGNAFARGVIAASYKSVNQITPMNNFNSAIFNGTSATPSLTINSAGNDMVVSSIGSQDSGITFAVAGGETEEANISTSSRDFAASYENSFGGSVSMDWTATGAIRFNMVGGNIQELSNGPLPVELTMFHANKMEDNIILNWQTAFELNNEGFEIQKAVGNAALEAGRWEILAFMAGNGTTNEIQNYRYTDERPQAGLNYYRLKQIDFDGKFEYSDIVSVDLPNFENLANLRIFPNPAPSGELTLYLPESNESKAIIRLYTQRGKLALQQTTSSQQETLNLSQLAAGIYFVEVSVGGKVFRKKVVVE